MTVLFSVLASACGANSTLTQISEESTMESGETATACEAFSPQEQENLSFESSPGGAPEVDASWVRRRGCNVHLVDVRSAAEMAEGMIEDATAVPLAGLADAASTWDVRQPVVLVCRSGRRSARGVELLESMGFVRAASMTGGMLDWARRGYPQVSPPPGAYLVETARVETRHEWPPRERLRAGELQTLLDDAPVRELRLASLLLQSSEACVDGRERQAVVGTPGGDAGELLLALAAIESLTGRPLEADEVRSVLDAHIHGFGRFYMHSDEHTMEAIQRALRGDARFDDVGALDGELQEFIRWMRSPPRALRPALLATLVRPAHIGCGHLRLVAQHPSEYGVRDALTRTLIAHVFSELWRHPENVAFVVLQGEHQEEAVINLRLGRRPRASSNIAAIPPRISGHSFFVNHPEASQFIRSEHVAFLRDEVPWLAALAPEAALERATTELAHQQLHATLGHLAARLPVYDVMLVGGRLVVVENPLVPGPKSSDPMLAALVRALGAASPQRCPHVLRQIDTDLANDHPRQWPRTLRSVH